MIHATFELTPLDERPGEPTAPRTMTVRGEVDSTNARDFEHALVTCLEDAPLVVDLTGLTFIDSAGFAALGRLGRRETLAIVVGPTGLIRHAATVVGLPFHDDGSAASEALQAHAAHHGP